MEAKPKFGIDKLLFGMKRPDVEALYGKPDRQFKDDEQNMIYLYDKAQWRLTFYEDEEFRLGYVISSNPELRLAGHEIIGKPAESVKHQLEKHYNNWEVEDFDMTRNHFNEPNWLILQSEFGLVTKIEMGVVAKNLDDFDWKFK